MIINTFLFQFIKNEKSFKIFCKNFLQDYVKANEITSS